jgi:hypothetical protein
MKGEEKYKYDRFIHRIEGIMTWSGELDEAEKDRFRDFIRECDKEGILDKIDYMFNNEVSLLFEFRRN